MEHPTEENTQPYFPQQPSKPKSNEANKALIKAAIIAALILVMLIPSSFISSLVTERATRQQAVIKDVSSKWATPQTINGPVLMVPYLHATKDFDGKTKIFKKIAYFLPDQLNIDGRIQPEDRKRSEIYSVPLYKTDVTLSGSFDKLDLAALNIPAEEIQWSEVQLLVGLNDTRGIEEETTLRWNNDNKNMESSFSENNFMQSGLSSKVPLNATDVFAFNIHLKVKGSEHLYFTPSGRNTDVKIQSPWENPKFDGQFLPNNNVKAKKDGFVAEWKIPHAARQVPQAWSDSKSNLGSYSFGVKLIQPTDTYVKTDRAVKYALLFIGLSFTVFFFIEILQKQQIHPLQYFLVGIALTVFYTLLLSISEYIGFNKAYAIAALATVSLIGLYVWNVFKTGKIALGFTTALAALYGYIFFLIQLQDYALLFGSVGLFLVVAIVMYSSRKVNWYQIGKKEPELA
jgi:inner membrane protein